MIKKATGTFCPTSQQEWRLWLAENHKSTQSVWLVYYKIRSGLPTLSWSEAVDEALCFGWIDSIRKSIDHEKFMQFFCKRKPNSAWSAINKAKVERLIREGMMTPAGLESIETAKQNGSWIMLDEVEKLIIPADLAQALEAKTGARDYFISLNKSSKKSILHWIILAKGAETRQKRIMEITELAFLKMKPKQFR